MISAICPAMRLTSAGFASVVILPLPFDGRMRMIGPFVVFAHSLACTVAAGALNPEADVRPHPHIGIATMSYLFDGAVTHRDSLGTVHVVVPGDVIWMVAGCGLVHSERYETIRRDGGTVHGLQMWIALPDGDAGGPSFACHPAATLPGFAAEGVTWRLLVGEVAEESAPVATPSPLFVIDAQIDAGATFHLPATGERALYIVDGAVECDGRRVDAGETVVFVTGVAAAVVAIDQAHVIAFGGMPIGRRLMWWNFIASRKMRSTPQRPTGAKAVWLCRRTTRATSRPLRLTEHARCSSLTRFRPDSSRPMKGVHLKLFRT